MSDARPLSLRFVSASGSHTTLALRAATGCPRALHNAWEIFGNDVVDDQAIAQVAGLVKLSGDGYSAGLFTQDCDIAFDPEDAGHTRRNSQAKIVFKRSMSEKPAENEVAYPAFPKKETLDLRCGPMSAQGDPIVSFCGVTERPGARKLFLEVFAKNGREHGVDTLMIERESFNHPDHTSFLGLIRGSHFVLCPQGVGRYSYRFYETLAAGRVPVIPTNGHTVAPAELDNYATIVRAAGPGDVRTAWESLRHRWPEIHEQNRRAWREHASPFGAIPHMVRSIRERLGVAA